MRGLPSAAKMAARDAVRPRGVCVWRDTRATGRLLVAGGHADNSRA